MKIWIDADACPGPVKEMVFRASRRLGIAVTLVANRQLFSGASPLITAVSVEQTLDAADHYLVQHAERGDLVITADIPLAARLVAGGMAVLNPVSYTHLDVYKRQTPASFRIVIARPARNHPPSRCRTRPLVHLRGVKGDTHRLFSACD